MTRIVGHDWKKLPNVLLCVSLIQILAESKWRREAYRKFPELRYLLNRLFSFDVLMSSYYSGSFYSF